MCQRKSKCKWSVIFLKTHNLSEQSDKTGLTVNKPMHALTQTQLHHGMSEVDCI